MSQIKNINGKEFERLLVLRPSLKKEKDGRMRWICKCKCGNFLIVTGADLRNNHTKSCGCLQKERSKDSNFKHGFSFHKFYNIYNNMKQRCNNINNKDYKNYGGRGIKLCLKWKLSFKNFKKEMYFKYIWAKRKYGEGCLTIERMNNDSNYCFENCIFIPRDKQSKNRRTCR
jgi:hypothetical protein